MGCWPGRRCRRGCGRPPRPPRPSRATGTPRSEEPTIDLRYSAELAFLMDKRVPIIGDLASFIQRDCGRSRHALSAPGTASRVIPPALVYRSGQTLSGDLFLAAGFNDRRSSTSSRKGVNVTYPKNGRRLPRRTVKVMAAGVLAAAVAGAGIAAGLTYAAGGHDHHRGPGPLR